MQINLSELVNKVGLTKHYNLRIYFDEYQVISGISKVTIDNIRRIILSFFSWLEDKDYIEKIPVRRIHKVKTCKSLKETYSDESINSLFINFVDSTG